MDLKTAYKDYLATEDKAIVLDGATYYKIILKSELDLPAASKKYLVVTVSSELNAKEGSVLVDELGNTLVVDFLEQPNYADCANEWIGKVEHVCFSNLEKDDTGDYLALRG